LGLRELGIAAELGLSSLSVPKRLLKGKRNAKGPNATYGISSFATVSFLLTPYCHSAKSAEPPPPYPPPQPFVSLAPDSVKNQIGLLRGYFEHRLAGLDSLPDDPQNPAQAKLGPLGQVIRPSSAAIAAAAGGSKKKTKSKDVAAAGVVAGPATGAVTAGTTAGVSVGVMSGVVAGVMQPATPVLSSAGLLSPLGVSIAAPAPAMVATTIPTGELQPQAQTPKKKKATTGAGTGATGGAGTGGGGGTGKKRGRPPEGLPPVVVASA
jgi:transcriptional activator SPT7